MPMLCNVTIYFTIQALKTFIALSVWPLCDRLGSAQSHQLLSQSLGLLPSFTSGAFAHRLLHRSLSCSASPWQRTSRAQNCLRAGSRAGSRGRRCGGSGHWCSASRTSSPWISWWAGRPRSELIASCCRLTYKHCTAPRQASMIHAPCMQPCSPLHPVAAAFVEWHGAVVYRGSVHACAAFPVGGHPASCAWHPRQPRQAEQLHAHDSCKAAGGCGALVRTGRGGGTWHPVPLPFGSAS